MCRLLVHGANCPSKYLTGSLWVSPASSFLGLCLMPKTQLTKQKWRESRSNRMLFTYGEWHGISLQLSTVFAGGHLQRRVPERMQVLLDLRPRTCLTMEQSESESKAGIKLAGTCQNERVVGAQVWRKERILKALWRDLTIINIVGNIFQILCKW